MVYISNISGNHLTTGRQRQVKHILDTHGIRYIEIDISDPKQTNEKEFLQKSLFKKNLKLTLPQVFTDDELCYDYDELMAAVESNQLKQLLKISSVTTTSDQKQEHSLMSSA
ncbi:unnamed protein product [Didymodactylos carnosus]|uniref:SH3 domain-binding glutamic acid-rich-like protein n=1 Tax=Didymodactylos carnosus TaxID=1234261 RepID=A0A814IDS3_9BILA|nr:unnamed protein product [Didymodactylos carnosus]CAF1024326.1 unnamed protein product [Didymodactylos carnosus]CAF3583739.1 unnamed protein product [Didymodactylos carnosus]CAF3795555.1 unnamed protein product [Didymodactylos carnosus]